MGNELAVEVKSLIKTYSALRAVDDISFNIVRDTVFAFLGPNGAGKTTTVEILECLKPPTSGVAKVLGYDVQSRGGQKEIRRKIGVLPQEFNAIDRLTVTENIEFFADMYSRRLNAEELINLVGLKDKANELFKNLSGGLKQKLGLAIALVNDPEMLFLDEPTSGLDPTARREVWRVIEGLKKRGKTVFLTTHYMEEAQVLADKVGIIENGKIVAEGTPDELISKYGGVKTLNVKDGGSIAIDLLKSKFPEAQMDKNGDVSLRLHTKEDLTKAILLLSKSEAIREFDVKRPTLETVYLKLTGKKVTDEGEAQ